MNALSFRDTEEGTWRWERVGGSVVTVTQPSEQPILYVDGLPAAPPPAGTQFLCDFLDELEAAPEIAPHLAEARSSLAEESISSSGGITTLRSLRLKCGLSQKEFAARLGTSQPRVSLLEARKESPGEAMLRTMSAVLGVDFNTLMSALENADIKR